MLLESSKRETINAMKIFNNTGEWGSSKVNFVDENNVLVGYDTDQCCCEQAGWFISDSDITTEENLDMQPQLLENEEAWRFDPSFFVETSEVATKEEQSWSPLDSGGIAIFKIVNDKGEEKFLHLFNSHNGYYSHGFEMKDGETTVRSGSL